MHMNDFPEGSILSLSEKRKPASEEISSGAFCSGGNLLRWFSLSFFESSLEWLSLSELFDAEEEALLCDHHSGRRQRDVGA